MYPWLNLRYNFYAYELTTMWRDWGLLHNLEQPSTYTCSESYFTHCSWIWPTHIFNVYRKGGMCSVQSPWKLIYIKMQAINGTADFYHFNSTETLQLQVVGTGRQVISRCETACVLPVETKKNNVSIFRTLSSNLIVQKLSCMQSNFK